MRLSGCRTRSMCSGAVPVLYVTCWIGFSRVNWRMFPLWGQRSWLLNPMCPWKSSGATSGKRRELRSSSEKVPSDNVELDSATLIRQLSVHGPCVSGCRTRSMSSGASPVEYELRVLAPIRESRIWQRCHCSHSDGLRRVNIRKSKSSFQRVPSPNPCLILNVVTFCVFLFR